MLESTNILYLFLFGGYIFMHKSSVLNILATILLFVTFICEVSVGALLSNTYLIIGACILLISLAFAIVALCTDQSLFTIGSLIANCISAFITFCLFLYFFDFFIELTLIETIADSIDVIDNSTQLIDSLTSNFGSLYIIISTSFYLLLPLSSILYIVCIATSQSNRTKAPKSDIVLQEITTRNYVDELKEYKFLLDNDIITQQEFDDKKQEILDLHNQKSV